MGVEKDHPDDNILILVDIAAEVGINFTIKIRCVIVFTYVLISSRNFRLLS